MSSSFVSPAVYPLASPEALSISAGGKADALAKLASAGFAVPPAIVLTKNDLSNSDWSQILEWWRDQQHAPLAARSSAAGEDSHRTSYAGQFLTILNIQSEADLKDAVQRCFSSLEKSAGRSYQAALGAQAGSMNVILQKMVNPLFAGVFFSRHPLRANAGWYVEYVKGLGETLVSGHVTPFSVYEDLKEIQDEPHTRAALPAGLSPTDLDQIVCAGRKAEDFFGYPVDMEWAIDHEGLLWVLQARPITTTAPATNSASDGHENKAILGELARLKKEHAADTVWDGKTFAEWTGVPSELSFDIWSRAFSADGAFARVLDVIGFEGFQPDDPQSSLLERVMGHAYLNLQRLEQLHFRKTPYAIESQPYPHLEFHWNKIDLETLLRTPYSIVRMSTVAWRLRSRRQQWLKMAEQNLSLEQRMMKPDCALDSFTDWSAIELRLTFRDEAELFSSTLLYWPLLLVTLAESAFHSLQTLLMADMSRAEAEQLIQTWMTKHVHASAAQTNMQEGSGFRGPGEMDLAAPRWIELGIQPKLSRSNAAKDATTEEFNEANPDPRVGFIRRPAVSQEWNFLRSTLELREKWKSHLMRCYARLRWLALEIGRRNGLDEEIFWLRVDEITSEEKPAFLAALARRRKKEAEAFQSLSLPPILALRDLEASIARRNGKPVLSADKPGKSTAPAVLHGESLAPGLSHGEVRVVNDPTTIDAESWPANTILVAQATDPGWTALFRRARGIVVERGGVLSHCAILAREMHIPAISGINDCATRLKDGEQIWVDGDHGCIRLD